MVQRKVANKVGIQGDHDKATDKRLGNSKPEVSQYQDGKNRGGHDFKKVLKKPRSIKLSDKESSRSSPALKPDKSLPGKPPTTTTALDKISAKAAAMQPKQSPVIKTSVGSANYMKSTSSSNARMESAKAIQTSSSNDKSSSQQKSTKTPSLKPMKALTRTPSLKLARGLKKIPSFKHVRLVVAKKGLKPAVCADIDIQRATCSSTLKDSKFPGYLMLNPGGTEFDGTSVFKVCTYKYCSLNGHFHTPLPPLKAFLSAKRRLLKAEKVMKLEALSPRANKSKDRPSSQEDDHVQIKDGGMEFFIEVYDGGCMNQDVEDQEQIDCLVKMEAFDDLMMISIGNLADGRKGEYDEQDAESVSNRSPHFEIDYDDDHLDQQFDTASTGINSSKFYYQESVDEDEAEDEEESPRVEMNEPDSDPFEVEWEEGQHIEPDFDKEGSREFELEHLQLEESESPVKSEYKLDDGSSNCFEEIVADVVAQDELDLDLDLEVSHVPDSNMDDEQLPFSPSEELTTAPTDELDSSGIDSALMEGPRGEVNASSDEQNACCVVQNEILSIIGPAPEDDDTNCSAVESDEPRFVNDQENVIETDAETVLAYEEKATIEEVCELTLFEEQQIDGTVEMNGVTDVEAVHTCEEKAITDEVCEQTRFQEQQIDGTVEENGVTEVEADESLVTTSIVLEEQIPNTEITEDVMEKINNPDETESVSYMPNTDPTQDFSVSALEYSVADDNEAIHDCHDDANGEDFELRQDDVIEDNGKSEAAQICLSADTLPSAKATFYARVKVNAEEQPDTSINLKLIIGSKKLFPDGAEERNFNPHEPNYLPLIPDPEAEKVDLRHQTEDERKNAEEWMLDYALRQAVTKLTPARSKRVALLVEAFETVKPKPKFETNPRHTSENFAGVRPLQTCI